MAKFKVTLRSGEIKTVAFAASGTKAFWDEANAHHDAALANQFFHSYADMKPWGDEVLVKDETAEEFVSIENAESHSGALKSSVSLEIQDQDGNVISNNFSAFETDKTFESLDHFTGGGVLGVRVEAGVVGVWEIETDFFDFPDLVFTSFGHEGKEYVFSLTYKGEDVQMIEGSDDSSGEGEGSMIAHFL